ncbi:carbohydrate kinase family protein [soil metagenome]
MGKKKESGTDCFYKTLKNNNIKNNNIKNNNSKKYDVITIGGAMEDLFFEVDDFIMLEDPKLHQGKKLLAFEYGCKIGVPSMENFLGGGANNAAISFSRLGLRTAFMGAIGDDDRGKRIISNLIKNDVSTSFLTIKKNIQTGVSFILVGPGNEHVAFTYRGANGAFKFSSKDKNRLNESRWLYVTSLSAGWRKTLNGIFSTNCKIAWNPGREQLAAGTSQLSNYLLKTKVLICNYSEARTLTSNSETDIEKLLKKLNSFGPEIIIITNGADGAHAFDGSRFYYQACEKILKPLNTTGVGDSFGSTFIAGHHLFDGDVQASLKMASKNAAAVVNSHGAQTGLLKFRHLNSGRSKKK